MQTAPRIHTPLARRLAPTWIIVLAACGFQDSAEIELRRMAQREKRPARISATSQDRFMAPSGSQGRDAVGQSPLVWEVPPSWQQLVPTSMRLANMRPGGVPEAECYLTVLGGSGGGLAANVTRWRGEFDLPPLEAEELSELPTMELFTTQATLVELQGTFTGMSTEPRPEWGMLGLILPTERFTMFVKMTGPADLIPGEYDNFEAFCRSIRLRMPESAQDAPSSTPSADAAPFEFELPEGWTDGGPRSMRVVNLAVGEGSECYIAQLPGAAGGLLDNLNRWCDQMGSEPLDQAGVDALPRVSFLGESAPLLDVSGDFQGVGGSERSAQRLLGTLLIRPEGSLFVKMVGPTEEVATQVDSFRAFVESLAVPR